MRRIFSTTVGALVLVMLLFFIWTSLPTAGATMLVRKVSSAGSNFTPADLTNLDLWLKADSLALNDTDPISTWEDSSDAGNNVTQTSTARPTYQTNEINSLPVVRFDGADDFFWIFDSVAGNTTDFGTYDDNISIAMVVAAKTLDDFDYFIELRTQETEREIPIGLHTEGTSPTKINYRQAWSASASTWATRADDCVSTGNITVDQFDIYVFTVTDSTFVIRKNGVEDSSHTLNNTTGEDSSLGASTSNGVIGCRTLDNGTPGNYLNMDLAELIICEDTWDATEISNIETYLNTKYSIY